MGQRIRRGVDIGKTAGTGLEKVSHAIDAIIDEQRCDIGQHQQQNLSRTPRGSNQRCLSAARGADETYRTIEMIDQPRYIAAIGIEQIVTVMVPAAVTMAAQIEIERAIASGGKAPGRAPPRPPALPAAVEEQYGLSIWWTCYFGGEVKPITGKAFDSG